MVGRTISHYRIVSRLAAGGMGVVFRAEDVRLGRDVAIKFVSEDFTHDAHAMDRLRSEARAASALNHPNICTIYDVGEDEGRPYLVMEFMKGMSLRDRLLEGAIKIQQVVGIGIDAADALHAAHSQNIVHRDIKPGNLFLTERGHVKILDFGLAKVSPSARFAQTTGGATYAPTEAGVTLGTVCYMSPEQATGEPLDGRTDIFSLGVVLYECSTGHHPFPGKTSAVTVAGILTKAPVAPITLNSTIPPRLQEVIHNCLEKDRELRYQSAADLGADLKRVRRDLDSGRSQVVNLAELTGAHGPAGSRSDSSPVSIGQRSPSGSAPAVAQAAPARSRTPWAVAAGAVVLLAAGGAWYVASRQAPAAPPDDSARRADEARGLLERADAALAEAKRAEEAALAAAAAATMARETPPPAPAPREPARATPSPQPAPQRQPAAPPTAVSSSPASPPSTGAASSPTTGQSVTPPSATPPSATPSPATPPSAAPLPASNPSPPPPAPSAPATVTPAPPAIATPPPTTPAPRPTLASPPPAAPTPAAAEPSPAARDEAAIRGLVASYGRAIETKDLKLFRTIKPNLSAEEERRLQDGFRAVTSQRVELTIASIDRQADTATVVVRRRDTIQAGGRQQTAESQQTLALSRAASGWVITNIR